MLVFIPTDWPYAHVCRIRANGITRNGFRYHLTTGHPSPQMLRYLHEIRSFHVNENISMLECIPNASAVASSWLAVAPGAGTSSGTAAGSSSSSAVAGLSEIHGVNMFSEVKLTL